MQIQLVTYGSTGFRGRYKIVMRPIQKFVDMFNSVLELNLPLSAAIEFTAEVQEYASSFHPPILVLKNVQYGDKQSGALAFPFAWVQSITRI